MSKIKRVLVLCLIFLLSINSFAAIVSDNDGSAFVTKAEFDALKNDFNNQIDNYNTSIDGKIDGAIASYLSGLNKSSTAEYAQVCYSSDGILSPRAGYKDLNFKMGTLKWDLVWFAYSGGCQGKYTETGKTPVDFNELGINDIYNNGTKYVAQWQGKVTDKQQLVQTGFHQGGTSEYWPQMVSPQYWQTNAIGFKQFENIRFNTYTSQLGMFTFSNSWQQTYPWGTWTYNSIHNTATRTISKTDNTNIIITPKSVSCKRFSRLDDVYDWCNCVDPDTTTFKKLTDNNTTSDLSEFLGSFKADVCSGYGLTAIKNITGGFKKGKSGANGAYYYYNGGTSGTKPAGWDTNNSWLPYFGFCNYYTDYNQLYINRYDNYISSMQSYQATLNVIADADGTKHLALNAGAPIIDAQKDQEVVIPIKFADTSKDYDVWFKIGSFDYDKDPSAETDLLPATSIRINGMPASSSTGLASNSYKIPSGNANVNIVMPKNGYIFMKWQYANASIEGGGTYMPASKVTVITYDN